MKKFSILVCLSCLCTSFSYAQVIDCDDPTSSSLKKICSDQFKDKEYTQTNRKKGE